MKTISRAGAEVFHKTRGVSQSGEFVNALVFPEGTSGEATYTVTGRNCTVSVDYDWGPPALAIR